MLTQEGFAVLCVGTLPSGMAQLPLQEKTGIAYLGGICSSKRKCVLAEDNGLNLAFTIAHELGHNWMKGPGSTDGACPAYRFLRSELWL
ncbi:A disintegrin and metalloproteinase with thrombospondin motifs 17 [Varanus komodoensis]|nr:A disintegrin and metalloproteinase with thrombospondin motifs 17 [Varanus komodoensis]